jgi:hypothetical protein
MLSRKRLFFETLRFSKQMKYFTYELIAAANDWIEQTEEERRQAAERFKAKVEDYHIELNGLSSRISQKARNFFRYGANEYGLHDGNLLSLTVGDGLNYSPDGTTPFRLNSRRMSARIEFLNYGQDFHYLFDLRGVKNVRSDLFIKEDSFAKSIGDLYCNELTQTDKDTLELGFLFASGATIIAHFKRLVFRRTRIKRRYKIGEMYELKRKR